MNWREHIDYSIASKNGCEQWVLRRCDCVAGEVDRHATVPHQGPWKSPSAVHASPSPGGGEGRGEGDLLQQQLLLRTQHQLLRAWWDNRKSSYQTTGEWTMETEVKLNRRKRR